MEIIHHEKLISEFDVKLTKYFLNMVIWFTKEILS